MQVLVLTFLAVVSSVHTKIDLDFCSQINLKPSDMSKVVLPDSTPEYQAIVEKMKINSIDVETLLTYYNTLKEILYVDRRTAQNETQLFAYPRTDQLLEVVSYAGSISKMCVGKPLESSSMAKAYGITRVKDTLKLSTLQYILPYSEMTQLQFLGEFIVRGIPARKWQFCAYQKWTNLTFAANIYYSTRFSMPGSSKTVPLLLEAAFKNRDGTTSNFRFDITNFISKVDVNDPKLEIPADLYCQGMQEAWNLPTPPDMFQFSVVDKFLGDVNTASVPRMQYYRETYSELNNIFVEDQELNGLMIGPTKNRKQIIHDFVNGLEFDLDLTTGTCDKHKIDFAHEDWIRLARGTVRQKTPKEFFNMKGYHYQYMGEYKHFDRGIDVDVFTTLNVTGTSKDLKITKMTWYFASKLWMMNKMGFQQYHVMPVRYTIQTNNPEELHVVDIYEFTKNLPAKSILPDVSSCFSEGQKIYIEILFKGQYDIVYLSNPQSFRNKFMLLMLNRTSIISMLRMANLRVEASNDFNTLVKFTLLDQPNKTGNAADDITWVSSGVIYKEMVKSIDSGKFVIDNEINYGIRTATAIKYKREFVDPESFAAKYSMKSTADYSSGAVGGLAVGMVILGIILGFLIYKGFKRYTGEVPNIAMERLGKVA